MSLRTLSVWTFCVGVAVAPGLGCKACRHQQHDECPTTAGSPPPCASAGGMPMSRMSGGVMGVPTSYPSGGIPTDAIPTNGLGSVSEFPAIPTAYGGPVYPVGEPVPLRAGGTPANELPYPTIPSTTLPEAPAASAPNPTNARTTADPRTNR